MCFVNAVLQLLVYSPPFWKLFRELGVLKRQRGAGSSEIDGGMTPLVDATVRFFKEFMLEVPPPTKQSTQQAAGGMPSEDEEAKKEHKAVDSFEPIYMYDAMKEKRKLKNLLVRSLPLSALLLLICAGLIRIGRPTAGRGRVFPALPRSA
jgi:ubiquitin carboxyl-terminal hydrolase 10